MRIVMFFSLVVLALGCGGELPSDLDVGTSDVGAAQDALLLTQGDTGAPLPCADPTVFSQRNREATWFIYCTGMRHVYRTTDWAHFAELGPSLHYSLDGLSAAAQEIHSWWAPSVTYDPKTDRYVMWVSVVDSKGRSLAVLTAPAPDGPWTYRRIQKNASAQGQMYIDPFLLRTRSGAKFLFWKQYGGGLASRIMGQRLDAYGTRVTGTAKEIINGYGGKGTWEDDCRENPAVWEDPANGSFHLLFSGGAWFNGTYGTGHAVSTCGPLCTSGTGSWEVRPSKDRNVPQVVQSNGMKDFAFGGPGGAEWRGKDGHVIVYAAAARSAEGDKTRYLFRERLSWSHGAPFVNRAGHHPRGF